MKEHKVQLRRKENTKFLPPEIQQEMVSNIGSVLEGRGPLRAIKAEKEKQLLSKVLNIEPDDPRFSEQATNFWASLTIHVGSDGTVLDITKKENGEPKEPLDYVKYLWAKKHPKVKDSKQEMDKDPNAWFYIYDPEEARRDNIAGTQKRKEAYAHFIEISEDMDKARSLLRVMGTINPDLIDDEEVAVHLEDYAKERPQEFINYAEDKDLMLRSEILSYEQKGVLNRVGGSFYYIDELLGNNMDETIKFFKNKKNSEVVMTIKAKAEEAVTQ